MRRAALALGLAAAALGCGKSRALERSASAAEARTPGLALTLSIADDERTVGVELRVSGPEVAGIRELCASREWADTNPLRAAHSLEVRDSSGPIEVGAPQERSSLSILPLRRAAAGSELTVRFTARTGGEPSRFALHRSLGGISGVGHAFLVRPVLAARLPLSIQLKSPLRDVALATSLDGRRDAVAEDLADAVYLAGPLRYDVLPSGDRAVYAFDTAMGAIPALEISRSISAAAARIFGAGLGESEAPRTLFLIPESGIRDEHDGADLYRSTALWIDAHRQLDGAAKILVAHETLHHLIGRALQVGEDGRGAEWFSEGFTTYYARRLLFDARQIDEAAFLADVARADDERGHGAEAGSLRAMGYGRGARYAAMIDAAVRAVSRGGHSLDDVMRALAALAGKAPDEPVKVMAFRGLVAAEVGEEKERALWNEFVVGAPPELPDDAFGPCFRRVTEMKKVPELGFDRASLGGPTPIIQGTVAGSEAARAGVADGALVLRSSLRAGEPLDPEATIELLLARQGGKKKVRYKPAATRRTAVFKASPCKR